MLWSSTATVITLNQRLFRAIFPYLAARRFVPRRCRRTFPQDHRACQCWSQLPVEIQSEMKKCLFTKLVAVGCLALVPGANGSADASKTPQFQTLPPLREQAKIVDAWTEERIALIPGILRKYNVDAWLVRPTHLPCTPNLSLNSISADTRGQCVLYCT